MSLLILRTLVIYEYMWLPKYISLSPWPSCPFCLECASFLPTWLFCLQNQTDPLRSSSDATLLSEVFPDPSSQTQKYSQKIFDLRISWFSSQKFRTCAYTRAKLPLYIGWVVLKPIWDNDDENSYHSLSTYYELGTMLSTVHTSTHSFVQLISIKHLLNTKH